MFACNLNDRCKKIIKLLLSRDHYTSMQIIAAETNVSKRSIYYDICKINEWLETHSIQELTIKRGKGILLSNVQKETLEKHLEEDTTQEGYIFLPSERVKIIICYVIHGKEPIYVDQLMEYCQVSRNTIFGDLRVVVNQLKEYDLSLTYESKTGYVVTGDTIRIRALYFLYFGHLRHLFENGILIFLNKQEIQGYFSTLKEIEHELNINYVEGNLLSLAALLPIMYENQGTLHFPGLKYTEIQHAKEYQAIQRHFSDLAEKEKIYLTLHLLGSRVTMTSDMVFDTKSNQSVYELTKALVTEFEKTACIDFEDREALERDLFVHINTSMYRYQYGIQIGNPMITDVMREYPNLYEITKIVSKYFEQMIGLPIPDAEVGFLALHFGAHLKVSQPTKEQLRILVVCANGISTGNMLKRELQRMLPYAQIVDVVAATDIINIQDICDLVISTVKIKSVVPLMVVNSILTDQDRKFILNHRLIAHRHKNYVGDSLFHTIKKYVDEEAHQNLKLDILRCLQGEERELVIENKAPINGLIRYLTPEKVGVFYEPCTWQESIKQTGAVLVKNGSIKESYMDKIISQTLYYGTYMFLTEHVMLAHAKPEDGVNKLDVSLALFHDPAHFPGGKRGHMILILAATDQERHLGILKDIFGIVKDHEYMNEILSLPSPEELIQSLKSKLQTIH